MSSKGIDHSLAILPIVGQACISRSIFEAYSIIGIHMFFHGIHSCFGSLYPSGVAIFHLLIHPIGRHPAVGTTRITQDHRKILLFHSFETYIEVFLCLHRNILRRILSRIAILIGVYTEHGEVACMAWPFPVVGIPPEFAYILRRSTHQAHILEVLIYKVIELIALEERTHGNHIPASLIVLFLDFAYFCIEGGLAFFLAHRGIYHREHTIGNIVHTHKEAYREALRRELIGLGFCPIAVAQVVMLRGRKACNRPIATVMVGNN